MTRLGLFEDGRFADLFPLTHLRPTFLIWSGIAPAWRRFEAIYGTSVRAVRCRAALTSLVACEIPDVPQRGPLDKEKVLLVNGALAGRASVATEIPLEGGEVLFESDGRIAAVRLTARRLGRVPEGALAGSSAGGDLPDALRSLPRRTVEAPMIAYPWDLVAANQERMIEDYRIFAETIESRRIAKVEEIGVDCYLGEGASVSAKASLDASDGPILIAGDASVEPFAFVRGPAFVGAGARVKAGCRLGEGATIGPGCRVGGEVEASILFPFVNKQHDGFLGHSIVGSWTNLGAGTITSDLKNNYGTVRSFRNGKRTETKIQKLGAIVGDHVKLGIGTMLAAGTVIGTAAQVAGAPGVVSGAVPTFAWQSGVGRAEHDLERAIETARTVLRRRGQTLKDDEETLLRALFVDADARSARERWRSAGGVAG